MNRLVITLLFVATSATAAIRPAQPLIEIVSGSETSVTYRERLPIRVRVDPASMLYHAPRCPAVQSRMQTFAPASATLQGYKPHSCARELEPEYATRTEKRRPRDPKEISVLFLGNSLTYFNQMPQMTHVLGNREPRPLRVESVTRSGVNLDQVWNDTEALKRLWQQRWDYVVLQGGGGGVGPLNKPDVFEKSLVRLTNEVRRSGATPLLFMTWPRDPATAEQHIAASQAMVKRANLRVAPVGIAWIALEKSGAVRNLLWDSVHPNAFGSYLIACTVYSAIYNKPAHGLPYDFRALAMKDEFYDAALREQVIAEDQAYSIQTAAWKAVEKVGGGR